MRRLALLLPLVALAAACAGPGSGYPSLAVRPAERNYRVVEPAPRLPPASGPDAEIAARIAALRESAATAHQAFLDQRDATDALTAAAKGADVGAEAWSVAQVSLAKLESARNDTSLALADIDAIYVAAKISSVAQPSPDLPAITGARDEIGDWVADENATLATFAARLTS